MQGLRRIIIVVLTVQVMSMLFFIGDIWGEILGFRTTPLPWAVTEASQVLASIGLVCGVAVSAFALHRSEKRISHLGMQIGAVSGQYQDQLNALFGDWALTQSEQAITTYAMKGFSNAEIGEIRGTSTSTIKSQMSAIYRKSGFANRQQIISFLVEELIAGLGNGCEIENDRCENNWVQKQLHENDDTRVGSGVIKQRKASLDGREHEQLRNRYKPAH